MTDTIVQPPFATQMTNLKYPFGTNNYGTLQRGSMQWDPTNLPTNYSSAAVVNFLFNPSTVTASYSLIPDTSVQAAMLFPTAYTSVDTRVPLSQTVEWSLLFDRTFELWGAYGANGESSVQDSNGPNSNDPSQAGVMVDIAAMQQFTGMFASFYSGQGGSGASAIAGSLYNQQGIMMPIYSYVYFGSNVLQYYGYVSEWDVTITHWTQYMVPMRCVINVTFTMLPVPNASGSGGGTGSGAASQTINANTDYSIAAVAAGKLNAYAATGN